MSCLYNGRPAAVPTVPHGRLSSALPLQPPPPLAPGPVLSPHSGSDAQRHTCHFLGHTCSPCLALSRAELPGGRTPGAFTLRFPQGGALPRGFAERRTRPRTQPVDGPVGMGQVDAGLVFLRKRPGTRRPARSTRRRRTRCADTPGQAQRTPLPHDCSALGSGGRPVSWCCRGFGASPTGLPPWPARWVLLQDAPLGETAVLSAGPSLEAPGQGLLLVTLWSLAEFGSWQLHDGPSPGG